MAYGARLESGLGASPQGFKSPILRARSKRPARGVLHLRGVIGIWEPSAECFEAITVEHSEEPGTQRDT